MSSTVISQGGGFPAPPATSKNLPSFAASGMRLNKFVRRLHDMLQSERNSGIIEWRRGLLVLHSTVAFAKIILPRYFDTRNFKTFRRQLNYYGFVHVRSFSTTGSTTTALWLNRDLAERGTGCISSVLMLKRVEPCEASKTAEGRRVRKELAVSTVEQDIGVSAKSLRLEQIRSMAHYNDSTTSGQHTLCPSEVVRAFPRKIRFHAECSGQEEAAALAASSTLPKCHPGGTMSEMTTEDDNEKAAYLLLMLSKSSISSPSLSSLS